MPLPQLRLTRQPCRAVLPFAGVRYVGVDARRGDVLIIADDSEWGSQGPLAQLHRLLGKLAGKAGRSSSTPSAPVPPRTQRTEQRSNHLILHFERGTESQPRVQVHVGLQS